jgi:hypothetical protein
MNSILRAAAWVIISATCCYAAEMPENPGKDLCLLDINNCVGKSYYNIVEKIRRLKIALKQGSAVYSQDELRHLETVLKESYFCVERIEAEDFILEE